MVIKTLKKQVEVQFPGPISLYLDAEIDYIVDTSRRYKPKVDSLAAIRFKINGVYQGVEELRLALKDSGCYQELLEECQGQETDNAEYGEDGRQSALGSEL